MAERLLEIDRVSKRYGDVVALRDLSFQVRAGEVFGFVGPNGSGKTTTMRIVLGVLAADAGQVRWAGEPVTLQTRRRIVLRFGARVGLAEALRGANRDASQRYANL